MDAHQRPMWSYRLDAVLAVAMALAFAVFVVWAFWHFFLRGNPEYDACVDRGVKHFREIGSYPRLKAYPEAGRLAEDVAHERCRRTLTAFGE